MIKQIYIKNFKAYEETRINLYQNNLFIGENDSGKSSILQALDAFFNLDTLDKKYVRDINSNVEIGVLTDDNHFIKKSFKAKTFKSEIVKGDLANLNDCRYIYISPNTLDIKKLISDLAISKAVSSLTDETKNAIRTLMDESIQTVIDSIDDDMLIVGGGTTLSGESILKVESAFKFDIKSDGVPIEGRGSGYQKNVVYSLLTGGTYNNVIIGIDEIENSLSLKNCRDLLRLIKAKFNQTLITTHSVAVVKSVEEFDVSPVFSNGVSTVAELYQNLGETPESIYVLVEGKTDVNWIKKAISILGLTDHYVILPCGGCSNINPVKIELENRGCICKVIKDGDTRGESSLSKECIELYVPLAKYNEIFEKEEEAVPLTKDAFFAGLVSEEEGIGKETIKRKLSDNVESFLTADNPLISEIRNLLG